MKLTRTIVVFLFLLAAAAASAVASDWKKIETAHFEVAGDAPETELRFAAERLERFRAAVAATLPQTAFHAPLPTRVVVFKDRRALAGFLPPETSARLSGDGFFTGGSEINYIAVAADPAVDEMYRPVFRALALDLLENSIGRNVLPAWLAEGLAGYFAEISLTGERAIVGAGGRRQRETLANAKLIPAEVFFAQDHYSLRRQTDETGALFRAQSWALVRYLLADEERANRLAALIEELKAGTPPPKALINAFGVDRFELDADFKRNFAAAEAAKAAGKTLVLPDAKTIGRAVVLSPAEARAIEGELLLRTGREKEAEQRLVEAVRLDERAAAPHVALGFLRTRERRFDEARRHAEIALKADEQYYLAHYLAAYATSREEMTGHGFASGYSGAQAEHMRFHLRRAIALRPQFAAAYELFAFVNFVRNEQIVEGLAMIDKALAAAPGNLWYRLRKAQLLTRREQFTEARRVTLGIIGAAVDDTLRVNAENALTVMNSLEAQLLSLKNARARLPESDVITDEPVSEEELRRRREKAMIESLNQALRVPAAGERRVLGTVARIECRAADEIVVTVRTENRQLRLETDSIGNLFLTAYDTDFVASRFGCGSLPKEGFSVVTFRPRANDADEGDLIAIEFVPKYFKFLDQIK